jgi:PAS domain S-box-containing protein
MKNHLPSRTIPWFLITIFMSLVAGIFIIGFIFYQKQQEHIKIEAQNDLAAIADLKVGQIARWRKERIIDAKLVYNNTAIARQIESYFKTPEKTSHKQDLLKLMKSFQEYAGYKSILLLDTKRNVRLSVSNHDDSVCPYGRTIFKEALLHRQVTFSDLHESKSVPYVHIDLMVPILSPGRSDSTIIGVLILRIDPNDVLFPLIQSWPTSSSTSETVLLEQDGDSIVYLNELRHRKNTTLTLRFPISNEQLPAAMAVRGIKGVVEGNDYRGVPVLAAIRPIPDSPWYMNAKVDREEIYAPLRSQTWIAAIGIFLFILAAGGMIVSWWRHQRSVFYRDNYLAELERQALIKHFDYIIKYANDSTLLIDMNGKIVEVNDQACRMYGYTREELSHLYIRDLRSQQTHSQVEKQMKQVEERGGLVFETEHRRKDGTVFPVEVSSRFIKIEGAKFYQSIVRDITERKRTEQTVQAAKEFAENLIQTANTIVVGLNTQGVVTIFNKAAEEITGYARQELANRTWFEVLTPRDRYPEVRKEFERLLQGGLPKRFENAILTKSGKERHIVWSNNEIYEQGNIVGTISFGIDITERKIAEEALLQSEERYRQLFELSPDTIFIQSEGNIVFINDAGVHLFGATSKEELIGRRVLDLMHPDYREIVTLRIAQLKDLRQSLPMIEEKYLRLDGSSVDVEVGASPFLYKGKPAAQVVVRDITERKQAENTLRHSEERFRRLVGSVTDYIYSVKLESGRPVATTHAPACVSVTGYTAEEYAADPDLWHRMIYEKDKQIVTNLTEKILTGFEVLPLEHRIVHKNGSFRWVKNTIVVKRDAKGVPIAYDGLIEDITMQKQADEVLRESEETAHALLNASSDATLLLDIERRIIAINEAGAQKFGKRVDDLIGVCADVLFPSEITESAKALIDQVLRTCKRVHFKVVQNGIHLENTMYPITDAKGNVTRIAIFSRDITEHIQAEEAIQRERNLLRTLIDNLPDAIYVKDDTCRKTIANPADVYNTGHQSEAEVLGKNDFDLFPKELAEGFFADDQLVLQTGKPVLNREEYILNAEGKKQWLSTSKLPLRNEKGQITGLVGIGRDITERMQTEEALRQSESLFKMLVESSPVAIAVFSGPSKKLDYVSDRFAELFGYNKEDIPSMDAWWQRAYPVEGYRNQIEIKWCETIVEAQREGSVLEPLESVVTCQDGSTKYIESTFTSIGEDTLVFFTDLTQHRLAQEALRQTHAFNELLIQTMPFGMNIVDEEGNILFISKAMKEMLTVDAVEMCCWQVYKDDNQQCDDCPLRKGISFGKPDVIEAPGILGGKIFQISHVGMMYEGKKAMLEVFQDITEQKKLQQELIQSQKLLSIGTMAGGIAHDFNNILGIILGYSSLLHSIKDNPQKFSDAVRAIRQSVDRGAGLVRQILTFARKTDISFEPLSISDLVKELVSMLQQTFPKIITFNTSMEKHVPYINADHTQIHQALLNLCVNARDAMPSGGEISIAIKKVPGEKLRGQFSSATNPWYINLSVSDTGMGMDEAIRSQIFDPFFTTKEKGKGTGLGLSVVYGIVQAHHGFVNVESTLERGTTFLLYFPVPQEISAAIEPHEQAVEQISGGNETLLLVEDETLLLDMVQILLESNGYTVFTAQDGEEAVLVYQQHAHEIALVISDMGLPKLTGVSEFEKMKEINPAVKIIFASGFFEPESKAKLENAGAKGFLQKPYVIEEVLSKIRKTLDTV